MGQYSMERLMRKLTPHLLPSKKVQRIFKFLTYFSELKILTEIQGQLNLFSGHAITVRRHFFFCFLKITCKRTKLTLHLSVEEKNDLRDYTIIHIVHHYTQGLSSKKALFV